MNALSKISGATPTTGGNIIRDGNYLYFVERITHTKGYKGERYVFEFRVIESEASGELDPAGRPVVPNAVGTSCSMVCLVDRNDAAAGNAKACVMALIAPLGYGEEHITEPFLDDIASAANPLRGLAVRNETRRTVNQGRNNPANAGKPVTVNGWKAVAQDQEQIQKQRAYLDANGTKVELGRATTMPTTAAPAPAADTAPAAEPAATAKPSVSSLMSRLGK